ncbi:MbnH family di-heme enzyme [Alteromonas sp. ASW11-130]|uniref:MbnH family di-heme enzyme n=1 Tax=Alteromonas sp. ASW11-130 TaxID=3015775 RepID=UPI002241F1F6|nr:MbnH family di-heme enzyme [Alteromonas sp. ASW11-130]MCW8092795.1 di-heme enzyme [Alteromonas sp. ASW11-130]
MDKLGLRYALLFFGSWLVAACQPQSTPYVFALPDTIPPPAVPAENPITLEKVTLGRMLFYDTGLSVNRSQSCATCHQQQFAFAEPTQHATGATGEVVPRNSMALVNVGYNSAFTWAHNGFTHIEEQLLIPLFNESPVELGVTGNEKEILKRFTSAEYQALFKSAFATEQPSFDLIVKALASFVRSLTSFNSPFDQYAYEGDDTALTKRQIEGMNLFFSERTECFHCHGGVNFSQSSTHAAQSLVLQPFHNTGLYNEDGKGAYPERDQGLLRITFNQKDMGKFRAPTLRNIAASAPYMHDGSIATLEEVIEFYAQGGRGKGKSNPYKSPFVKGFNINEDEKAALKAFLESLTDHAFLTNPKHGPLLNQTM